MIAKILFNSLRTQVENGFKQELNGAPVNVFEITLNYIQDRTRIIFNNDPKLIFYYSGVKKAETLGAVALSGIKKTLGNYKSLDAVTMKINYQEKTSVTIVYLVNEKGEKEKRTETANF